MRTLFLLVLWCTPVAAAEVILTVPTELLDSRLKTARAWRHCNPLDSDATCLTKLANQIVPVLSLGHDASLEAAGVTVEVRR